LIEIINKQLLLQLVGYLCYWQMGFNSVFKGLMERNAEEAVFVLLRYFRRTEVWQQHCNQIYKYLLPFGIWNSYLCPASFLL